MSMTVSEFKDNLSAMLHGRTLNKVRNVESAMQRAANTLLSRIDPVDTIRIAALSRTVHDNLFDYSLPSDYKKIIDLYPQTGRESLDDARRNLAGHFDLRKEFQRKRLSIEGSGGSKVLRLAWKTRQPVTVNELNSVTANGTWSVVATADNLVADTIDYVSGNGSLRFDAAASGDGLQNTTMSQVDLTDEDEVGEMFLWFKVKNSTDLGNLNSVSLIWGNDLTDNFWTGVAQTVQADGTAFKVGWNQIKVPWSTATETGTVDPSAVDSVRVTFAIDAAITSLRVDNIVCSIGKNFDVKYYSKLLLQDSSGTWIEKSTSDDDVVVLDNDCIQLYLLETLIAAAHQVEGTDSGFDITWAKKELMGEDMTGRTGLYAGYKSEYPSMAKKAVGYYGSATSLRHFR